MQQALDTYSRRNSDFGLIHGDFHLGNYNFHRGSAGAFDFDDTGWGSFIQDISGALSYAKHPLDWSGRSNTDYMRLEQAFVEGYGRHREMPGAWEEFLPSFVLSRLFITLDWMTYHWPDIDHYPWGKQALRTILTAMDDYISSG